MNPNKVQAKLMDQAPWLRELRQRVRVYACPKCGAEPGRKCTGVRGAPRYRNHKERWQLLPDCPPMLKAETKMQPPTHFDNYDPDDTERGEEDDIRCRRCGADGLYWMKVTTFDGRADKPMLFDATTKRRHVCTPSDDAFEVVPE